MKIFYFVLQCVFFVIIGYILKYYWSRRNLILAANKFYGPISFPIIGNAHQFYCKTEDILYKIHTLFRSYKHPLRFWLGQKLIIGTSLPNQVEKILTSSNFSHKDELYEFVKIYLGEGLVSASGLQYKKDKRIIQPLLDVKFCKNQVRIFQKYIDICMKNLESKLESGLFNINIPIHKCFVDIIGEIMLGTQIKAQSNKTLNKFVQSAIEMYNLGFTRMVKPWLHPDFLYNITHYKSKQDAIVFDLNSFIEELVIDSYHRRKMRKDNCLTTECIIDKIGACIEENPNSINSKDLIHHLITLYAASEDTLSIISSFAAVCFGLYPEYQWKAAEEIRDVLGENFTEISIETLNQLPFVDMCIKEVLRLFPIAPFILRKTNEDFELDSRTIPKGAAVVIPIFNLHRDPVEWEKPEEFYPNHFLPEAVRLRHKYSYIPFSAGPRSCIGKILANLGLKLFLCNLLNQYEISANGTLQEVKLKMDISVRPRDGYNVKITKRVWRKNN